MKLPDHARMKGAVPKPGARHPVRFNIPDWTHRVISGIRGLVSLYWLIGMLILLPVCAAAQTPTKRVLILSGSDPNYPGFSTVTRKIVSTLRGGWQSRVEVLYELQEALVEPPVSPGSDEELASYLKRKYADKKVDLILSLNAPRVPILIQKEPGLFGNVPKIFYEFESEREAINRALGPNITGVWTDLDLNKTLELALALHPDTRKVVVVSGHGAQDNLKRERAQVDFRKYEKRAEFSYLKPDTIEELKGELAALDKRSVVIYLMFTRDKAGNRYSAPEAISMIAPTSNAPIYGYSDTYMGFGITGGNLQDFEALGGRIGEMSLRVLAGERPEQIPQETAPTVMTVDWRELQRWGVSERSLPPGSVVKFRQSSFWALYKWYIISAISLCILQAVLIVGLLINRAMRRRAEKDNERLARVAEVERQHLDEVVSNVPGLVWEVSIDPASGERKTTFVSRFVEPMLGYREEDFLGTRAFGLSLIPEEDRERVQRETNEIFEGGKDRVLRFRWVAKDGRVLWVETHLAVMRDETGCIVGLRGVTLDISEGMQAEEARNNLASIVESSDDAIWSKNLEGIITSWNPGAERMYGYAASEIIGRQVTTLAPADEKKEVAEIMEKIGRGESVDHLETVRLTQDGRRIDVSLTVSPIKGADRRIVGAATIARDITARKKTEAEAIEQRAELAHLSRVTMLGELSGSLAHELNQPLTAILSNAQAAQHFLAHDNVDLDEVREILQDIVDQDKRAGEVIHRLRLLLKKGEVEVQPVDVNNAVREVLKLIRGDLVNQSVSTLTKLEPGLPTVRGDRVQLQQVLLNLVMNACDAMNGNAPADRQIVVSTELSDDPVICFSVSDRGHGLAGGELEKVFEPFFTSKAHGLGLGLAVCRSIITAHGGKLWAVNNPEQGATFHFTLPVHNGTTR